MKICGQCSEKIDESRLYDPIIICQSCGAVEKRKRDGFNTANYWTFVYNSFFICLIFISAAFYLQRWDRHILKAAPLEVRSILGIATASDLLSLSELCELQRNYKCVTKISDQLTQLNPKDVSAYLKKGHILFLQKNYALASESFKKYYELGGQHEEALFEFAVSLKESGQAFMALHMFEKILESKKDVLQITVYENYIQLLIEKGEVKKAIKTIEYVQRKATQSFDFMKQELDLLRKKG